jgi:hypothetical protein
MQYSAVLELHPNREVRIGYGAQRVRKKAGADTSAMVAQQRIHEAYNRLHLIKKYCDNGGYAEVSPRGHIIPVKYTSEQYEIDKAALLDIINGFQELTCVKTVSLAGTKFQPPAPPPQQLDLFAYRDGAHPLPEVPEEYLLSYPVRKYTKPKGFCDIRTVNKPRQFGTRQRRALLRSGAVMSNMYPEKGQTYEVTLTIPGSTKQALKCVAAHTGWLANRLLQVVRDEERKCGQAISWFYVWEWQKRGALHMHMAIGTKDEKRAKSIAHMVEFKWFELLLELKEMTGIDVFKYAGGTWRNSPEKWQSHVAKIEKNLAAYFAKYASKDKDSSSGKVKYYPVTWWGRSRDIAQAQKEQTIVVNSSYLTENEATEWYVRIHQILGHYECLKEYSYDYQVEGQPKSVSLYRDGNVDEELVRPHQPGGTHVYAYGERRIMYFDDEVFQQVKQEVEQLAAWMRVENRHEWTGQLPALVNEISRPVISL